MNGRVYDPNLGRFLQADPFIQFPSDTQSYNRYSYVLNNPLAYTDPSGYFSLGKAISGVFKIVTGVGRVVEGDISGLVDIAQGISDLIVAFESNSAGNINNFAPGVSSGAFSGIAGPVQVGAYSSPGSTQQYPWDPTTGKILGSTYSEMTGGKFANGAITAAYAQALNRERIAERKDNAASGGVRQQNNGPSLWDRINPFSEHNLKLKHAELQKYCAPNCTNTISPEMAEIFSELTGGTLGAIGLGKLPSTSGRLIVTRPNVGLSQGVRRNLCVAGQLCALSQPVPNADIVFDGTVNDVNRAIRHTESIRRGIDATNGIQKVHGR